VGVYVRVVVTVPLTDDVAVKVKFVLGSGHGRQPWQQQLRLPNPMGAPALTGTGAGDSSKSSAYNVLFAIDCGNIHKPNEAFAGAITVLVIEIHVVCAA
jgi:hypothetical protein